MPSFLSKVFARRKDDKDASQPPKRASVASLLEGKFEAVSPPASPSATATSYPQSPTQQKEKEKAGGFPLFRVRSPRSTSPQSEVVKQEVPHLTLSLPGEKEKGGRALFEADQGDRSTLPDNVIGERRLSPPEALELVKACSTAIIHLGGLETLGVMHPHWLSASPDVQRRLISLFILSLARNSPSTLPPSPNSPSALFNTELEYTRSPHDLAAVLRWALRHVRLEGDSFGLGGSAAEPWIWYKRFLEAERAASYPMNAFSQFLVPQLPPVQQRLLEATLEIISSLASHSEHNGVSGSKLAKLAGLWLLLARRVEEGDDWESFYARWERAGRILEHLFLAQIRDEMTRTKMPRRLAELVASYPYAKAGIPEEDLLPRPRLSTRTYDALYVRVETQLPTFVEPKSRQHPQRMVADAIKTEVTSQDNAHSSLWELVKNEATKAAGAEAYPTMSHVFTDETTRLLSLVQVDNAKTDIPATVTLAVPEPRGRSRSVGAHQNGAIAANGNTKAASTSDLVPKDWMDFSSVGFSESSLGKNFAATLMDTDLEVTEPPLVRRRSSRRQRTNSPSRTSLDAVPPSTHRPAKAHSKCTAINIVQLDEAFIDFWTDALLDPIASDWPNFVICELKSLAGLEANGKPLSWLVLEQAFTKPPPPPEPESAPALHRTASPRPSLRSNISARKSATFSSAKKRFTLFSSKDTIASLDAKLNGRKKPGKAARVGEMGEILSEEPEPQPVHEKTASAQSQGSAGAEAGVGVAAVAVAETVAAADAEKPNMELTPVPIVEAELPTTEATTFVSPAKDSEEPADKPTKFVEHITPTNTSVVPSPALEPNDLPPPPEPVVLAGETPGPDVALSTSEPVALTGLAAQVEPPIEPSSKSEATPVVREANAPDVVEPTPDVGEVSAAATEPVDVKPPQSDDTTPTAAPVHEASTEPQPGAEAPNGFAERPSAIVEAIEPPIPGIPVLPTREPAIVPTVTAEAATQPFTEEVAEEPAVMIQESSPEVMPSETTQGVQQSPENIGAPVDQMAETLDQAELPSIHDVESKATNYSGSAHEADEEKVVQETTADVAT